MKGQRSLVVLMCAAASLVGLGSAQASPAAGTGSTLRVVATGLDGPRGLSVLPGGVILVAEAGHGGSGPCIIGTRRGELCLGASGAVTAIAGRYQLRIADGLPSLRDTDLTEVLGPHDVVLAPSGIHVTLGLGADPANRAQLGEAGRLLGQVIRLGPGGRHRAVADLAAFEAAHNPDQGDPGSVPDSNPFGLIATGGELVVADAGGNDVLRVDRGGRVSLLGVFRSELVPGPEPGTEIPMSFVPTSVARGPDGAFYVGQETGFPFPVGGARVWRLQPGHPPEVFAQGFTNIIDVAFDQRGRLLVLELARNGVLSGDPTGALIRVEHDGRHTELASEGLVTPVGLAVGPDGSIFVSNKGTTPGGGEVVQVHAST